MRPGQKSVQICPKSLKKGDKIVLVSKNEHFQSIGEVDFINNSPIVVETSSERFVIYPSDKIWKLNK